MGTSQVERADFLRASLIGHLPSPQPADAVEVKVQIGFSHVMMDYCDELYLQFQEHSARDQLPFTSEELEMYLKCLLRERVINITGGKAKIRPFDGHSVPAMFAVMLEMIGRCEDSATGIILTPVLSADLDALQVDVDWMNKFSLRLRAFERCGFVFAKGLPRPKEGDFDFMSFEVLDGEVRHMRNDKPEAYAVCAAMLSVTGLSTFFGKAVYRVAYGTESELKLRARDLALPRAG